MTSAPKNRVSNDCNKHLSLTARFLFDSGGSKSSPIVDKVLGSRGLPTIYFPLGFSCAFPFSIILVHFLILESHLLPLANCRQLSLHRSVNLELTPLYCSPPCQLFDKSPMKSTEIVFYIIPAFQSS